MFSGVNNLQGREKLSRTNESNSKKKIEKTNQVDETQKMSNSSPLRTSSPSKMVQAVNEEKEDLSGLKSSTSNPLKQEQLSELISKSNNPSKESVVSELKKKLDPTGKIKDGSAFENLAAILLDDKTNKQFSFDEYQTIKKAFTGNKVLQGYLEQDKGEIIKGLDIKVSKPTEKITAQDNNVNTSTGSQQSESLQSAISKAKQRSALDTSAVIAPDRVLGSYDIPSQKKTINITFGDLAELKPSLQEKVQLKHVIFRHGPDKKDQDLQDEAKQKYNTESKMPGCSFKWKDLNTLILAVDKGNSHQSEAKGKVNQGTSNEKDTYHPVEFPLPKDSGYGYISRDGISVEKVEPKFARVIFHKDNGDFNTVYGITGEDAWMQ